MPYSGDYLIGLDMGTSSVGWAVTDMEYHILKQKGKALWGIRLFDAAQTAAARRVFRTNRRRNERKKQRIQWLQQLFDAEIAKAQIYRRGKARGRRKIHALFGRDTDRSDLL